MTPAGVAPRHGSGTAALESLSARVLAHLAVRPVRAALILIALVLSLDLAGNLLLPPLDRTEVIYAQTARQMLEPGGSWTAPAFQAEPLYEKPLAVLWLQATSAWASDAADQIRGYRIPSIVGTILAVLLTFWGARHLFDPSAALVGAALLGTMLVVTVQATLAMPEALMLAATCAALFAMGRAYAAREGAEAGGGNAFVFWLALGLSVLVNVVTVPLIALLTALALVIWDRGRAAWLRRLWSLPGLLIAVALTALWPLALWLGGTLDPALAQWREQGLHLLLGPQEMKWRVVPGLFVVFLLLGMFPAGLFLGPAMLTAWRKRTSPAIRFLVAWVIPYLLFLEIFTRKTPLYMVQAMLPPLAVLFAVWVMRTADRAAETGSDTESQAAIQERSWYRFGTLAWLLLVTGLVIALWVLPLLLKMTVSPLAIVLGVAAIGLAFIATKAMLAGHRLAAATSLLAMSVAFNNLTIPVTFAGLRPVWVATELRAAIEPLRACGRADVIIAGHSEPSTVFELGTETTRVSNGKDAALAVMNAPRIAVISASQRKAFDAEHGTMSFSVCVAAYDFIKSCSHRFEIGVIAPTNDDASRLSSCLDTLPARFRCRNVPDKPMMSRMCK